ncbi:hypothetical protein DOTSEDRAFT_72177 [Dothistroma septosporum NZE10]|uniref:Uncharacterized protein n=1 Tax=Dothistroma septosporum (strain NZE10 / CBS 128990) TaxID=675120 RepID=N1PNX6_DOTSN|nr:hypothetical protein DOTSEDRAFT_72177 [Dothistroma septosporum NZE10]
MAAPRATQLFALRNLARGSRQARNLSMTGPATYASPVLSRELPRDMTSLRAEPAEKRPVLAEQQKETSRVRHFNTSRELKANHDTSTIDFAYLPDIMAPENIDVYSQVRVPILPTVDAQAVSYAEPEETIVMKPEISVMSADAVYLPMSESTDGHAMNIDFHAMADRVAANLRRLSVPAEEQASMMKQIWGDMVDDMMGLKKVGKV